MSFRPVQKKPCGECPFRRAAMPGWLGAGSPESFIEAIQAEKPMPCHSTINYEDPNWATLWSRAATGKMCIGALTFAANMHKRARNPNAIPNVPRDIKTFFETPKQFIDHHRSGTMSWQEDEPMKPLKKKQSTVKKQATVKKLTEEPAKPAEEEKVPICALCKKDCSSEAFCFGCKAHICDACDTAFDPPCGPHDPRDHQESDDD